MLRTMTRATFLPWFWMFTGVMGAVWVADAQVQLPPQVERLGMLQPPALRESSGIVVSHADPGVFWTHNDGKSRTLFAVNRAGALVGSTTVEAQVTDWEDIASDHQGHLYLADTGNNTQSRNEIKVHEMIEPNPRALTPTLEVRRTWVLRFPREPFDSEGLFVWNGYGYLISKVVNDAKASLYRFPLRQTSEPVILERVTKLKIDSPVTGADISTDGTRVAFVSKSGAGVFKVATPGDFKALGEVKPFMTKFRHEHVEACCFVTEGLLATAESREVYLFTAPEFKPEPVKASSN
jgi:hypothetical protein